ncbi:hypothetical protein N7539_008620 [Penicillium diatomitis]|uniref:Uncharacterized protein n=1 Tax=Penicillium diatomitis TaxID=2819901 RepID=A0A9W9WQX2_9EURO|nr:uncharacterized protein N7539_008620 [Penicillium diatomitis]KAJ5472051.1 hypothetical protein N7539_008620 [Penicillium diatomitis]
MVVGSISGALFVRSETPVVKLNIKDSLTLPHSADIELMALESFVSTTDMLTPAGTDVTLLVATTWELLPGE